MSMDTGKRIGDLIVLSQRLADLLAKENRALREGRPEEVRLMLEQKDELSRAYESRVLGLSEHSDGESISAVDPASREQLRELGKLIQELSAENGRLLQVAMEVNRRVLHGVAEALRSSQPGPGTYSKTGDIGQTHRRKGAQAAPLSLDQSF